MTTDRSWARNVKGGGNLAPAEEGGRYWSALKFCTVFCTLRRHGGMESQAGNKAQGRKLWYLLQGSSSVCPWQGVSNMASR